MLNNNLNLYCLDIFVKGGKNYKKASVLEAYGGSFCND